ncbi:AlpA family phage regulatory protein [Rhodobacter capsulatus]|uniref:Transcriptional regulator, AlpA family n=1 Tax=Rhodobacter capsulatus TaxID=1061 RepID=A0A1G7H1K7_RHOCA|nr:AlpA family phage regulatory protein [Rhodobacter capsulatus]PZX27517.1 AlpA family transcriptional regulator [Rhodobacter capsulatus]QNR64588.1 AlpA family phage regulatory protein [Rhodobacter capsulatus]WER07612.1 AlpA family phage regulatory protein [Rhodobacter capsulatus]SDE94029.1 transcriptional regulator, AlpA family [Rhodobacter capsulatus]
MFLSDKQTGERYSVSRVTVWRWRKADPTFPAPVQLSPGCVRWRLSDLEAWEAAKAAATSAA